MRKHFFIEITDTFAGEANYSWVTRHKVRATTPMGAMRRIGNASGLNWRKVSDYGDSLRYDSASGATCAFVSEWSDTDNDHFHVNTELA